MTAPSPPPVVVEHGRSTPQIPPASFIWLHGLGADGHDFEPIVPELRLPENLPIRFLFPHAPIRRVTINGGLEMRAWYDITGREIASGEDDRGIRDSAKIVEELIARERGRGVNSERILLGGFSQGGAMACHCGLRHRERLGGILVLSAYLPLAGRLGSRIAEEFSPANRETPILQCHGTFDPMVPLGLGESSKVLLERLGYRIDWRTYPMAHGLHPKEVADIGRWIEGILAVDAERA